MDEIFFLCMRIKMNDSASIPYASAFNAEWTDMFDAELAQNSDIIESGPLIDASNATSFTMLSNGNSVCDTCMASDKRRKPKRRSKSPKGRRSKSPKGRRSKSPKGRRSKSPKGRRRSVSPALMSLMDSLSNSHFAYKVKSHCKVKKGKRKSKSPARKGKRKSKSPARKGSKK
jgi:hypothetical protein